MQSNAHLCIFYDPAGKNVGLEGRRLVLTLLAGNMVTQNYYF